ncbi:hypothetical protein ES703_87470 [subsurface metagenome]
MSPKKKQTKKSRMETRAKANLKTRLSQVWLKAQDLGFKTPQEYMLFEELRKKDVEVRHNVHLLGTEIDLYVPPKLVIEVGFRDEYLMKKWYEFEEKGFDFLYFQNVEIHDPNLLKKSVREVMTSIHAEVNDSAHDEKEKEDPPVLKLPAEGSPDLNHLKTHDKKQFKRLRSDLNRCKQILNNEIENLESTPDREEERKAKIRAYKETIELIDNLLSRIQRGSKRHVST